VPSPPDVDVILVNTPISSPLHPQLNLPLLKAHLQQEGFSTEAIDSNIDFFHWFTGGIQGPAADDYAVNPLSLLSYYNDLEARLWQASRRHDGLHVGMRSLAMKHDRLYCDGVADAIDDRDANPFIEFYERMVEERVKGTTVKVVGIAITFQDQIIPTYTLAAVLRRMAPEVKIALGGQIVTRCHDTIVGHPRIGGLADYLVLWDGEVPLAQICRKVIRGEDAELVNVIDMANPAEPRIERKAAALKGGAIPAPDFTGFDFDKYLLPELLIPFQTTRGCYARCAFCAIPYGSNSYRVRPSEQVVKDILAIKQHVREHHNREAVYFKFMEDTSAPGLLHDIAVEIERLKLDVKWETFARLEKAFAADGFLEQLYRGGCRKIHWGLESNDPDILVGMKKKTSMSHTDEVLRLSGEAGIMNFCFVLVGFPGETDEQRTALAQYIIDNPHIHTITLATFDLTRRSPMEEEFTPSNPYKLDCMPATDFQVRLPYTVGGENWKEKVVPVAHQMIIDVIRQRPDIGFVTLFPDQIRSMLCDRYGNDWGKTFVERYGEDNIREMLLNTEKYASDYANKREIDPMALPEPLRREHFRTKEDMALLAKAVIQRREYEQRRFNQV
jgi:hypothetical protein